MDFSYKTLRFNFNVKLFSVSSGDVQNLCGKVRPDSFSCEDFLVLCVELFERFLQRILVSEEVLSPPAVDSL